MGKGHARASAADYRRMAAKWLDRAGKPDLLFVAESPPKPVGDLLRYFYNADEEGPGLAKALAKLFDVDVSRPGWKREFLGKFSDRRFALLDLCEEPLGKVGRAGRRAAWDSASDGLRRRVEETAPTRVVILLKRIDPTVRRALRAFRIAGRQVKFPPRFGLDDLREAMKDLGYRFDRDGRVSSTGR